MKIDGQGQAEVLTPDELEKLLDKNNVHLIKLISPMTDKKRSQMLLKNAKGFVYYISAI